MSELRNFAGLTDEQFEIEYDESSQQYIMTMTVSTRLADVISYLENGWKTIGRPNLNGTMVVYKLIPRRLNGCVLSLFNPE